MPLAGPAGRDQLRRIGRQAPSLPSLRAVESSIGKRDEASRINAGEGGDSHGCQTEKLALAFYAPALR